MKLSNSQSQRLERHGVRKLACVSMMLTSIFTMILVIGLVGGLLTSANEMQKKYHYDIIPTVSSSEPLTAPITGLIAQVESGATGTNWSNRGARIV